MSSLAVYDLLVGLTVLLRVAASAMDRWPFGTIGCTIAAAGRTTGSGMSIALIILMNVDRYIAITKPYRFPVWCTRSRVITLVLALSLIMVSAAVVHSYTGRYAEYYPTGAVCYLSIKINTINYMALIFFDIVPTVVITYTYCRMIQISRRHERRDNRNDQNKVKHLQDNKALKSFLIVTFTFATCFTPFFVMRLIYSQTGTALPDWLQFIIIWLAASNSALNVFIYCLFNKMYRQTAKKILLGRFRCCNVAVEPVII